MLLVFVLAQFFLTESAVRARDARSAQLQGQMAELADVLALERKAKDALTGEVARLSAELQASLAAREAAEARPRLRPAS